MSIHNVLQLGSSANLLSAAKSPRDIALQHFPVEEFIRQRSANPETVRVYRRVLHSFLSSPQMANLRICDVHPDHVFAYCKELEEGSSASTVRQALAAIRGLLQWAVEQNFITENPAAHVRGPRNSLHCVEPADELSLEDKLKLINRIEFNSAVDFRDQALLAVLIYSHCTVEAVSAMHVPDFYLRANRWWFRLQEKNRTTIRHVAAHPVASRYVSMYEAALGVSLEERTPLFRTLAKRGRLSDQPLSPEEALSIVRRRAKEAGLPSAACCESFTERQKKVDRGTLLVPHGDYKNDRIA